MGHNWPGLHWVARPGNKFSLAHMCSQANLLLLVLMVMLSCVQC